MYPKLRDGSQPVIVLLAVDEVTKLQQEAVHEPSRFTLHQFSQCGRLECSSNVIVNFPLSRRNAFDPNCHSRGSKDSICCCGASWHPHGEVAEHLWQTGSQRATAAYAAAQPVICCRACRRHLCGPAAVALQHQYPLAYIALAGTVR